MAQTVIAVGRLAVIQSASILAASQRGAPHTALRPGIQWRHDRMLLSLDQGSVRFLVGNILYKEDMESFLSREFSSRPPSSFAKAPWLASVSEDDMPFCMSMASAMALAAEGSVSACAFLERCSCFYCAHRAHLEQVAGDMRHFLQALFILRRQPKLFKLCIDSMGKQAPSSVPNAITRPEVGSFLGRLLIGIGADQLDLANLASTVREMRQSPPEAAQEFLSVPHHQRTLDTLESFAERAVPQLQPLRQAWQR